MVIFITTQKLDFSKFPVATSSETSPEVGSSNLEEVEVQ